jgi:hypothetical protein
MNEEIPKKIFYKENNKSSSAPERDVYLELLALEIYSYKIGHSFKQKLEYPASICIQYAKYENKYWKFFNTSLRRFDGYLKESWEGEKRNQILEIINNEIQDAIDDAYEKVTTIIDGLNFEKNEFDSYRINLLHRENEKAHPNLKNLFKEILSKTREENLYIGEGETENINNLYFYVPKFGKTFLNGFHNKVLAIAKAGSMLEAFEFLKKRMALSIHDEYKFKKQVKNIVEACENSLINSKVNKLKSVHKNKSLAELAEVVVNNNEIIGNRLYLIDQSGFKKAVEKHIRDNSKKYSSQDSN